MVVESVMSFVEALRHHKILEPDQLAELTRLQASFPEPRVLAKNLMQRGWLTPYQINQLMAGRGGDLNMGQYVILERLGEGGMGQVFKARHRRMDRAVAIKVIRRDLLNSPDAVKRFKREMQATASLSHPNIVMALDADQVGDNHFFVMEYVEGIDLGSLVKRMGPPPVAQTCDYMRQTALGLEHACEKGMVHRDIKPSNLLVSRPAEGSLWGNTVKILDMGVARIQDPGDGIDSLSALTKEGRVVGTPDFMAPEQAANSAKADIRSDLYSLGCTFYYLLTGQPPFPGGTPMEKLLKQRIETAKPVDKLRPEVPAPVVAIVQKLMAKRPEERFQAPAELVKALDAVLSGKALHNLSATPPPPPPPVPRAARARRPSFDLASRIPPGLMKRWPVILGAGLLILLGFVFLIVALVSLGSRRPTPRSEGGNDPENPALRELLARANDAKSNPDALRRDILRFRLDNADNPDGLEAARLFMRLPSPFDDLKRENIPAAEAASLPADVVALLGERRQRHWGPARAIATSSPLGLVASGGTDALIRLWDLSTMQERGSISGHTGTVNWLDFLPDGQTLVSLSQDGTLRFWDNLAAKPREHIDLRLQIPVRVDAVALSPDGKTLAYSGPSVPNPNSPQVVRLFDVEGVKDGRRPRPRGSLTRHTRVVRALAFSADNQSLASASDDQTVVVWDLAAASPKERRVIPWDNRFVPTALAFNSDNSGPLLAVGSTDHLVRVYDLAKSESPEPATLKGHGGTIVALAFVPGVKRLVSASNDSTVRLWDLSAAGASLTLKRGPVHQTNALDFAGTPPRLYTASQDATIRQWHLGAEPREVPAPLQQPAGMVNAVAFLPDGKGFLSGYDGDQLPRLWDLGRDIRMGTLNNPFPTGFWSAVSLDGQTIVTSGFSNARVLVWRPGETGAFAPQDLPVPGAPGGTRPSALAISPDGKMVAAGAGDGTVRLCNVAGPKPQPWRSLNGHTNGVVALAFSPDGKTLASADDRIVRRWNVDSAKELTPPLPEAGVAALAFSPDGKTLAVAAHEGSSGTVHLYELVGAQLRLRTSPRWARVHNRPVTSLSYTPDGGRLASASQDGDVMVFGTSSGNLVGQWHMGGLVRALGFAGDGRHLAVGNANGTVYVLRVK